MHGTKSAVLQRNFLFAGGIYRPASFFHLNLRMTRIRLYTIPYMPPARSILYRLWGSFCPDELATCKAGSWRSLTQGSSGTSSRTKSFTTCLARPPRILVLQASCAEDRVTTDKVKNSLQAGELPRLASQEGCCDSCRLPLRGMRA